METKKLLSLQGINMTLGFVIAMGFVFIAFEWENHDKHVYLNNGAEIVHDFVEVMMPITYPEKKVASIPLPKHRAIFDVLEVVQDMPEDLEEQFDFADEYDPSVAKSTTFIEFPSDEGETDEKVPLVFAEVMPQFPGGNDALMKFLNENVNYPYLAAENGIDGMVMVRFVVTATGSIDKIEVVRSVHGVLDRETVRVVKEMPRWIPGSQRGKKVSVYFTLPVRFTLR